MYDFIYWDFPEGPRVYITSQPLALVSQWEHYGAQARPSAERGDAHPYAAFPVPAVRAIGEEPRHALPRGAHADGPDIPGNAPATARTVIIIDRPAVTQAVHPIILSPFLAQHIAQEVLGPEEDPSRHRTGSAAYLAVRDSTAEFLGAGVALDFIV